MDIKNIVIAGGGILGSQIAYQCAFKKFHVTIWLRSEASIERARPKLARLPEMYKADLEGLRDKCGTDFPLFPGGLVQDLKTLTPEKIDALEADVDAAMGYIRMTTDLADAVKDADIVIESVAEQPEDKVAFYQMLAPLMPAKTILATNSSTMLPSAFAQFTGRPEKYLAMHFANEIWRNNIAEIMGHPGTDPAFADVIAEFAEKIAMVPMRLKKEQPGYILNSLLIPYLMAAQTLVADDVADPETIDRTWQLTNHSPLGPLHIADLVGTATAYNITSMMPGADDPATPIGRVAVMLKKMIAEGKNGINSGEGFFKY